MAIIYNNSDDIVQSDSCLCFLTPNSSVLEFGSASGYHTRFMKEILNCEVTCIEKIPEMAIQGEKYAKKMINADLEQYQWENELGNLSFDFIIFADVLEHLKQPELILKKTKQFLKPGGFILTSIQNIGHNDVILNLIDSKFTYNNTGLLDNTHIHFFTRESIFKMFNNSQLFCVDENHKLICPCNTELKSYYTTHPFLSLSLINKTDGHVYRFVNKWSDVKPVTEIDFSLEKSLSFGRKIWEILYDLGCYLKRIKKMNIPKWVSNIIFHP